MRRIQDYLLLIGGAGGIVALDQWTKYLVRSKLQLGESWMPVEALAPYLRVVHWNNTGAAFGLFPSGGTLFTVIAVLVAGAILYYFPQVSSRNWWVRLALILQMGGAIGNLIDRLLQGPVTDFISIGSFPVFNVADSSISIGVAILVVSMVVEERQKVEIQDSGQSLDDVPEITGE